jgi:glucokinase
MNPNSPTKAFSPEGGIAPSPASPNSIQHVIGIDVGGTKIAAGLAAFPEGRVLSRRVMPTLAERGGPAVLDEVVRLARELADEGKALGLSADVIGLGVCELVDRNGKVASANCIQWLDLPVRERLSAIAPATIEADVRAAALAEALFGAGRSLRNFLYVTVGTGISCCLMLDGKPYLGARGVPGTMGSTPLRVPCERCGEVNKCTLEEIAAGPALVARFKAAHGTATSGQDVLAAAGKGDPVAEQVVRTASEALGSQVGLLVNVFDPEAVVIGGGLGLSEGLFWEQVVESTRRHIWSAVNRALPILRAATGADAGWLGAAARAWHETMRT